MQAEERQRFIQRVRDGVAQWEQTCTPLSAQTLDWHPLPEKWSIKQITLHVADGFEATIQRIQHILAEEKPWILSFDADQWASERGYEQRPWSVAMARLKTDMERFIALVAPLDETALQRQGQQRNIANILGLPDPVLTIGDLIRFEALHVEEHLSGVNEVLQMLAAKNNT
jgi:hypothetical protein